MLRLTSLILTSLLTKQGYTNSKEKISLIKNKLQVTIHSTFHVKGRSF